jgi:hypothetical protein
MTWWPPVVMRAGLIEAVHPSPYRRTGSRLLRKNERMPGGSRTMPHIHHLTVEQAQRTLRAEGLPFKIHRMQ